MEENKRPRKNGPCRKGYKDVSTQTSDNEACHAPVPEICGLCHNRVLSVSSPNDIPFEDDLPDNICQCFFSDNADVPEAANFIPEARFGGEQNAGLPNVQNGDSPDSNSHRTERSNSISKNDTSSSEESKFLESSFSSNSYVSSPSELSFNPHLPYPRRRTPVSSEDKSSQSSSSTEQSPSSSEQASSVYEQLLDQNVSDQRCIHSPISGSSSRNSSNTGKNASTGYPVSPGERSSDENFADRKKSTSPSSGEDLKRSFNMENDEASTQSLHDNLEHLNISEFKFDESFSSDRDEDRSRRGEYCQYPWKSNENVEYERNIPTELAKFRSNNPRPVLPPPFFTPYPQYYPQSMVPSYQLHGNPPINMSMPRPSLPNPQHHTQSIQPYVNPAMNMPINRTDIPGRFPVVSRPQMTASYQHPYNEGNGNLSKKLLSLNNAAEDQERKSVKTVKRIEDWLENVASTTEEALASGCASVWSSADNEENEGIPPGFSEIFLDEQRSSAEISEEENHIQRSLKHPPRKNRK